jgi:hypothetical protein
LRTNKNRPLRFQRAVHADTFIEILVVPAEIRNKGFLPESHAQQGAFNVFDSYFEPDGVQFPVMRPVAR